MMTEINKKDSKNDIETKNKLLSTQSSNNNEETLNKILNNMSLTKDITCGFGCFKGSFMQKFANQTSYVVVYGLVGCVYAATNSYFHGTISTLEKRYKIPSRNTGIVMAGNDISQVFCSAFVGYYAGKGHKPRWMGIGLLTLILFCLLTVTPHFIYGAGEDALSLTKEYGATPDVNISFKDLQEQQQKRLCRNDGTGVECEVYEGILLPQILLFLAQFVAGIGSSLYHTLGVSYMDDNTEKSKAPAMLSISYFFGLMGPSLGYTLASICLRLYIAPYLTPIISQSDSRWLGGWWLGWLIMASLISLSGIFLIMFPKELPMTAARRKLHEIKAKEENNGRSVEDLETKTSFKDMLKTFKKFLQNRIVAFNLSANILYFFGYSPYWIFTAKYIEIQYRQSAATSSMVTGTVALICSAIGILLSGIIISKFKPGARYLAAWNVLVDVLTASGMLAYAFIGCSANDNSIISYSGFNSSMDCNSMCHCDYVRYMPVCGENQMTYISPCHAGCKKEHMDATGHKSYYDCACIASSNSSLNDVSFFTNFTLNDVNSTTQGSALGDSLVSSSGGQAIEGACPVNCSHPFYTFLAVMCIINFFAATGRASNLLITMRSVAPEDKSAIMGFGMMSISLLCFVPAPIFFGWIFDRNCLVWGKTCTNKGNCWSYDSMQLRFTLNIVAAGFVALGTFCNMGVWYHVKDLKVFDEDENMPKDIEIISLKEEKYTDGKE